MEFFKRMLSRVSSWILDSLVSFLFADLIDSGYCEVESVGYCKAESFDYTQTVINREFRTNVRYDLSGIERACMVDTRKFIAFCYEEDYESNLESIICSFYVDLVYCKLLKLYTRRNMIEWNTIIQKLVLSENFIRSFRSKLNWYSLSWCQKMSEDFIMEFKNSVDWVCIMTRQDLSEPFITKVIEHMDHSSDMGKYLMDAILINRRVSENFMSMYVIKNRFGFGTEENFASISMFQKLSENFIEQNMHVLDLAAISKYQTLSESFVRKWKHLLDMPSVLEKQSLSLRFIEEYQHI